MKKLKDFITSLHTSTNRDYLARMSNDKIECMKIANKFEEDYWDGDRKFGYGGYKYIEGRWKKTAQDLITTYNLKNNSKILDIGCGKGFLLFEIKKILPNIEICGIDRSNHAIKNSPIEIRKYLNVFDARKNLQFKDKYFDLTISINTLHNFKIFDLCNALKEIDRVSKKSYLCVESFRNEEELFNLECWALTCQSFFSTDEWLWIFDQNGYKGDYEFIYF